MHRREFGIWKNIPDDAGARGRIQNDYFRYEGESLGNLGTENPTSKKYGCTGQTTVVLLFEHYRIYCHCWLATRTAPSRDVYNRC